MDSEAIYLSFGNMLDAILLFCNDFYLAFRSLLLNNDISSVCDFDFWMPQKMEKLGDICVYSVKATRPIYHHFR